jgi:ribose transport system substrate-binding protein
LPLVRRGLFGVVSLIACVALAACGSSSSSSSTTSTPSSSSSGSSGNTGSTTASSGSSGLSQAQAIVAKYEQTPTAITITTPIGKAVPKGKTIDFIDCGIPTCTAVGDSLSAAAAKLGWTVKSIPGSTEPAGAQQAFHTAIQQHPDGVAFTGVAAAEIQPELTQLQKMKIPVADCCTTDPIANGITNVFRNGSSSAESGRLAAAFVVANSGGKANTLYVDLPVFVIYKPYRESFASTYKKLCPSCQMSTLPLPATALGKNAPQLISNYLAAHRSINYVFVVNDAAGLGLPAAMQSAGVTGVKYVGSDSTPANFPTIESGQELATIPASTAEFGWYEADALARAFAGTPQQNEANGEEQIVTAKTVKGLPVTGQAIALNPDYQSQFEKLWGVS